MKTPPIETRRRKGSYYREVCEFGGWEVKIRHSDPISSVSEVGNKVMSLKRGGKEEDWRSEKSGEYLELSLQSRRCSEVEKYLDCVECG